MRYLEADEIFAIHERVLETTRGLQGVRDAGLLFSISQRPKTVLMGQEMFPSLFEKAAAYLEALVVYHVFNDGNIRTAITTTSVFLAMNGYRFDPSDEVAFRFILAVATKKKAIKQIAVWLKKNSRPIS